jgi:nucleoside-diphosphate-sugar epimerase
MFKFALLYIFVCLAAVCAESLGSCKNVLPTIAIFGGTGLTGKECVYQALQKNHKVIAFGRDVSKLTIPAGSGGPKADELIDDANLVKIQGDVTKQDQVDALFAANPDISGVIVALGGRTKSVGPSMLNDGTTCIINAMKKLSNAKRISVVTSIGVGDSAGKAPFKFKMLMYTVMRGIFADKNKQEQLFLDPAGPGHDLEYVDALYSITHHFFPFFELYSTPLLLKNDH